MNNAELISNLTRELKWTTENVERAKVRILEAADQLAYRAGQAVKEATALVNGKPNSFCWIDRVESDIDDIKRAEQEYKTLVIKQTMLLNIIETAEEHE